MLFFGNDKHRLVGSGGYSAFESVNGQKPHYVTELIHYIYGAGVAFSFLHRAALAYNNYLYIQLWELCFDWTFMGYLQKQFRL